MRERCNYFFVRRSAPRTDGAPEHHATGFGLDLYQTPGRRELGPEKRRLREKAMDGAFAVVTGMLCACVMSYHTSSYLYFRFRRL